MEPDELRRLITGGVPADLERHLVVPEEGRRYHHGTTVPILDQRTTQRPSGLLVVGASPTPAPIDQFAQYLTATEVYGRPLRQTELEAITQLSANEIVLACSALLHGIHGVDATDLERRLANDIFDEDLAQRVAGLLRSSGARLLAPQLLLLTSAAALSNLQWTQPPERVTHMPGAVALSLHIGDMLYRPDEEGEDDFLVGNLSGALAAEVVANQIFNSSSHILADMARHEAVWRDYVPRVTAERNLPDLLAVFEEATGVPMEIFESVGFGLYAAMQHGVLVGRSWFSTTALDEGDVEAVIERVATSVHGIREQLAQSAGDDIHADRWALGTFSERPLLEFDSTHWLVHSPQLLIDRFFSGLAFFDAWFEQQGGDRDRVKSAWGVATEWYGVDILRSLAPGRVYAEDEIQRAFEREGARNVDAAIDYADSWVVLDFTQRRVRHDFAIRPSAAKLHGEVETLLDKAGQLQQTIDDLREDEERLTHHPARQRRRFYPSIVVHSRWPVNPVTTRLIQVKLSELDLLQGTDIAPLEVIPIEDLEMVKEACRLGGFSFATLLDRKQQGPLMGMPLKDHILRVEGFDIEVTQHTRELFDRLTDRMVETMRLE